MRKPTDDQQPNGKEIAVALARIEAKVAPVPEMVRDVATLKEDMREVKTTFGLRCPKNEDAIEENRTYIGRVSSRVWALVVAVGLALLGILGKVLSR